MSEAPVVDADAMHDLRKGYVSGGLFITRDYEVYASPGPEKDYRWIEGHEWSYAIGDIDYEASDEELAKVFTEWMQVCWNELQWEVDEFYE